jgi:diketogulonate reductase-like aldo/keto reductase
MGEDPAKLGEEVAALELGLDLEMSLIDTAEMYAEGGAEEVVHKAVAGRRANVFLVSKFYPYHADRKTLPRACADSLRRLGTDYLDLYLLHWRGGTPLAETLDVLEQLKQSGKIRDYGLSNFDCGELEEALALPGGADIQTDQVLYNLSRRGIEWDLVPFCREHSLPLMAYSPIEQGRILGNPQLRAVAQRHAATPAQAALAWLLHRPGVIAIPKAATHEHVRENRAALDLSLTGQDCAALDRAFPPPAGKRPLEML